MQGSHQELPFVLSSVDPCIPLYPPQIVTLSKSHSDSLFTRRKRVLTVVYKSPCMTCPSPSLCLSHTDLAVPRTGLSQILGSHRHLLCYPLDCLTDRSYLQIQEGLKETRILMNNPNHCRGSHMCLMCLNKTECTSAGEAGVWAGKSALT